MALQFVDRVKETTTTTGTGALALGGAMTGFQAFSSACAVGDTCYYSVQAVDGSGNPSGAWEVGLGTYSAASTLTRTTVLASSNAGAAVSFATGTKQVWLDMPAARIKSGTYVLAKSGVASSALTGTLTATALATIVIPAGTLTAHASLRVRAKWGCVASGNTKTVSLALAGTMMAVTNIDASDTGAVGILTEWTIDAVGATNAQIGGGFYTSGLNSVYGWTSSAIDMTQAQNLTFVGQLTATADTLQLLAYSIEVLSF